ncbi:MAG TPA: hypothetical protein VIL20_29250 [Sandaracinaceae bacterium]
MAKSGSQPRPLRALVVAPELDVTRVMRGLRAARCIPELARDVDDALRRLERAPAIDVLILDGLPDADRDRLLAAGRERGAWCVYLRGPEWSSLPPAHRHEFVAALAIDADEAQVASTVATILAARRAPQLGSG